jgi:hypothetical protein
LKCEVKAVTQVKGIAARPSAGRIRYRAAERRLLAPLAALRAASALGKAINSGPFLAPPSKSEYE